MHALDTAISEARLLHGREGATRFDEEDGFFSIFRKPQGPGRPTQRTYNLSMLDEVVSATRGNPDVYLSQSSFMAPNRLAGSFKSVRAAWVDLDLYAKGLTNDSGQLTKILAHGEKLGLPAPSSVIHSGRGVYLKWYFERPVATQHLPAWNALQSTLTAAYHCLAADAKSRDVSRVFRLLETINSKSGGIVHRIEGTGKLYDFAALCAAVEAFRSDELPGAAGQEDHADPLQIIVPRARSSVFRQVIEGAERGDPEALELYSELRRPIMLDSRSAISLNWRRFLDLRDLAVSRGGIAVGERDLYMLWMLNSLAHSGVVKPCNWDSEVRALQRAFPSKDGFDVLADGSMSSLKKRLELKDQGVQMQWRGTKVSPLYRPSNEFLIQAFAIKPNEQQAMRTIIGADEQRQRRLDRLDETHEGRAERREHRLQLRRAVAQAFDAALTSSQHVDGVPLSRINLTALAKDLGADRSSVSRLWGALLKEHGLQSVAQSRRKIERPKLPKPAQSSHIDNEGSNTNKQPGSAASQVPDQRQRSGESPVRVSVRCRDEILRRIEKVRQSVEARQQAYRARQDQQLLAGRRRLAAVAQAWAERKVQALALGVCAETGASFESTNLTALPRQGDTPMATSATSLLPPLNALERAKARLRAVQAQGAVPRDPSHSGTTAAQVLPSTATQRIRAMSVSKQKSGSPALPSAVRVGPAREPVANTRPVCSTVNQNSAQERLRAISDASKEIPPYLRESVQQHSSRSLIEGGPAAPDGYPDSQAWPDNNRPPGSRYSSEDWERARCDESGRRYAVLEMQSSKESMLVQIPLVLQSSEQTRARKRVVYKDGQPVVIEAAFEENIQPSDSSLAPLIAMAFSDCLLVTEDSWPQFKDAAEAKLVYNGIQMRVIRPRADYLDLERAWRVGSSLISFVEPPSHGAESELDDARGQEVPRL